MRKWFVGYSSYSGDYQAFYTNGETPSLWDWGLEFDFVIGPFITKRGAKFMEKYGRGNPHCQSVYDAERLAKKVN